MAKGLGRGLEALLPSSDSQEATGDKAQSTGEGAKVSPRATLPRHITAGEGGTLFADIASLKPNPHQPRVDFDAQKLSELTESIRREGVLSPVLIEEAGDGLFYIIAGERRVRAAKEAGLTRVPVLLRQGGGTTSDQKRLELALVENVQRADLNPIEEASAYSDLMKLGGFTQEEVASRVGKNRSTVANSLRLLKLPSDIRKALADGSVSAGHAKAILSLDNEDDMRALFAKIERQGLSVRQAESQAKKMQEGKNKDDSGNNDNSEKQRDPNFEALEQRLIAHLATKVQLKGSFAKGSIVIDYFSAEDLDRIFSLIAPGEAL